MGVSFSCPFANLDELDARFESYLVRQFSFEGEHVKTVVRSLSFDAIESISNTMKKSRDSGKMILEGSLSFNGRGLETKISLRTPPLIGSSEKKTMVRSDSSISRKKVVPLKSPLSSCCNSEKTSPLPLPHSGSLLEKTSPKPLPQSGSLSEKTSLNPLRPQSGHHRNLAAVRLQKTYKSFRTRRQLADCAVLAEQKWWKVLDFAELKSISVSFFDIEKHETAISRWSRAKSRAAKVGKGLSKAEKARKLALQHWLEAIDPRHRYGHNLQFYYVKWLQCESKQPFFYWLDIGEGKEVNLEKCGRYKLQQQCIKYLGPIERKEYEVAIEDGKLLYKESGQLLDTRGGPEDVKWIFVLSVSKILYVGQKKKGVFQHSSFLAGGATLSAGRLIVEDGILKAVWPHSGHYLPTEENFEEFISYLEQLNVDLSIVQRAPTGEEEEDALFRKTCGIGINNRKSESDLSRASKDNNSKDAESTEPSISGKLKKLGSKISLLQIPSREDIIQLFKRAEKKQQSRAKRHCVDNASSDGYETAEEDPSDSDEFSFSKRNLFDEVEEKYFKETIIPKEKIMKRIKSHKSMQSLQLANQLSCRWTTGAGPRIGCMRDYPSELQFRVLEEAHLSPRSSSAKRSHNLIPSNLKKETLSKSPLSS